MANIYQKIGSATIWGFHPIPLLYQMILASLFWVLPFFDAKYHQLPPPATIKSCKKSEITHPRWFVKTLPFFRFRCASTAGQKHPLNVKNGRAFWSISGSPTLGRRYGARGNYYLVIILQAKVIIDLHVCQFPPTRSARMVFILSPSRKVIKG